MEKTPCFRVVNISKDNYHMKDGFKWCLQMYFGGVGFGVAPIKYYRTQKQGLKELEKAYANYEKNRDEKQK